MEDQPVPLESHYSKDLLSAVEVMSAMIEAYESNGDDPDTTLADYLANQLAGEQSIPAPVWDVLSGFANWTHLLLGRVEELTGVSKQDLLDLYADAAAEMTDRNAEFPGE
jgi:hypothetical protein